MTEAQKKASSKYDKNNTRTFCIKLNYNTDGDLIAMLEARDNIQGFIKEVLTAAMLKDTKRLRRK